MSVVNNNLVTLEAHVNIAEEELGVNELGLKGLLKPIFSISKKKIENSVQDQNKIYETPSIFRTTDFFGKNINKAAVDT